MSYKNYFTFIIILSVFCFQVCFSSRSRHSHGGPGVPDLPSNTFQNKYLWKCLDMATNPLYLNDCNKAPSQIKFYIGLLQQSYPGCAKPFKIYGPGGTVLSWNKKKNNIFMSSPINANNTEWCYDDSNYEESFTIHPYGRPQDCLSAPFKEGDPVFVVNCYNVENDIQILGISWELHHTLIIKEDNDDKNND